MNEESRLKVAAELVKMAELLMSSEEEIGKDELDEIDPKFIEKIRNLKIQLPKLVQKRGRKLRQFGVPMLRPNNTVEDLVDALLMVVNG